MCFLLKVLNVFSVEGTECVFCRYSMCFLLKLLNVFSVAAMSVHARRDFLRLELPRPFYRVGVPIRGRYNSTFVNEVRSALASYPDPFSVPDAPQPSRKGLGKRLRRAETSKPIRAMGGVIVYKEHAPPISFSCGRGWMGRGAICVSSLTDRPGSFGKRQVWIVDSAWPTV